MQLLINSDVIARKHKKKQICSDRRKDTIKNMNLEKNKK